LLERGSDLIRLVPEHYGSALDAARRQAAQYSHQERHGLHLAQRFGERVSVAISESRAEARCNDHCTFDRVIHHEKKVL
jgi:hypothetical protein